MIGPSIERLVSLPAGAVRAFPEIEPFRARNVFAASDPPGGQLGSGGGTAHLLASAWQKAAGQEGASRSFSSWISSSQKLLVHGSGESRRLPAYAALGKPLTPIPSLRGIPGQRPDQVLLDLQLQTYERLFWYAPAASRVMVTCGDVIVRVNRWIPEYPDADVLIFGLASSHEEARHHGVILCPADEPGKMACFVQKPTQAHLEELEKKHVFYLDTGVWLLSERATMVLMKKCGWNDAKQAFRSGVPDNYDLFGQFGTALGAMPAERDSDIGELTCAVVPLANARFYHFGTNATLLASVSELRYPAAEQRSFGHVSAERQACVTVQNAEVSCGLPPELRHVWIENSHVPSGWTLGGRNVLTGVPHNNWTIKLEPGVCLDFAPVGGQELCVRFYGFEDSFRGRMEQASTLFLGKPAGEWFSKRGISLEDAGISPEIDIFEARLFPSIEQEKLAPEFVAWLFADEPVHSADFRKLWLSLHRMSGRELLIRTDVGRTAAVRAVRKARDVATLTDADWLESCAEYDLASAAELYVAREWPLPVVGGACAEVPGLSLIHDRMFRHAVANLHKQADAGKFSAEAFDMLKKLIVDRMELEPVVPRRNLLEDQVVWGRAPIRLDLAGGWTDTPPFCLEYGGRVVNVAVDLNGQPPIQIFGRLSPKHEIVIRSIDLGIEEHVRSYDDLRQWGVLGSGFGIAKAALALSGFDPRFHSKGACKSLEDQLMRDFGGGIEISMVCAIPKGSGLGTSSILAASLLGTLSEMCGLGWSTNDLFGRTLALEQMLTAGGGWQDQVGGVTGGVKFIETTPGIMQKPVMRWLPNHFFSEAYANKQILLYYTGLTRIAHGILGEIVRGMFLNSSRHLGIIGEIGHNAIFTADAIQRNDWNGLCEAIRRSWNLNQRLDSGTNPPQVQAILDKVGDHVSAAKLLGAGGGGYILMLAKDVDAASRIRSALADSPPNNRARFVDLGLSAKGFQVTRS
ncbi:MAG: bifunctional fucokinase/fucose-1-phosphate guanylyltransferase [bacterium]